MTDGQEKIDGLNTSFWEELCGTHGAKKLGITDNSYESLKSFDDWYMDFYPYLNDHIPFSNMLGRDVLEVGLGYGTITQKIAEVGAIYKGLDIAAAPVAMANKRIEFINASGEAVQGTILAAPFVDASFDYIVAIGCLHHAGNLQLAINECHRMLRPSGQLIFMVYNAYSYRRFLLSPWATFSYWLRERFGYRGVIKLTNEAARKAYDQNGVGEGAPHTDWISSSSLEFLCRNFSKYSAKRENMDNIPSILILKRKNLLNTFFPRLLGLDIYAIATK